MGLRVVMNKVLLHKYVLLILVRYGNEVAQIALIRGEVKGFLACRVLSFLDLTASC